MTGFWYMDDSDFRNAIEANNQDSVVSVTSTADNGNFGYKPRVIANPNPSIGWISRQLQGTVGRFGMDINASGAPAGDTIALFHLAVMGQTTDPPNHYGDDQIRKSLTDAIKPQLLIGVKERGVSLDSTTWSKPLEEVALKPLVYNFFRTGSGVNVPPRTFPAKIWVGHHAFLYTPDPSNPRAAYKRSAQFRLQFQLNRSSAPFNAAVFVGRVMHGNRKVITPRGYVDGARVVFDNPGTPRTQGRYPTSRRQQTFRNRTITFVNILQPQLDDLLDLEVLGGDTEPMAIMPRDDHARSLMYARVASVSYVEHVLYYDATLRLQEIVQADVQQENIANTE